MAPAGKNGRRSGGPKEGMRGCLDAEMIVLVPFVWRFILLLKFLEPASQPRHRLFCKSGHQNLP